MKVIASSFADPADVRAFERAKASGMSDEEAFRYGDNGIGCWGDNTAQEHTPMCALPPDDMEAKWGSVAAAKHRRVLVSLGDEPVECILADRMPWKRNIKNGAGIDLNPAAVKALGIRKGAMVQVTWQWK